MKIKHDDIIIDKDKPFFNCKLKREPYAEILTNVVNTYAEGFVLAVNNEWGAGKTTFVKMWKQYLENKQYKTIYFNAWENDFDSNPLAAIMSELDKLTNSSNDKLFKSVLQKGALISKNVLPAVVKSLAKKYIVDTDIIIDAFENTTKAATEILEEEIKEYINKKKGVEDFREELTKFIAETDNDKPIIFIIDELDRCRPTYAVELLEQMKHFFSVKGIVFVLSIDKEQLSYAIKGFYGNDRINSDEYLRRFIDLEYSIPSPFIKDFCNYLYDYYSFDPVFQINREDKEMFLNLSVILFKKYHITLRQQEKIYGYFRLVISSFKDQQFIFIDLLFILVFTKIFKSELYFKIKHATISLQELSDEFYELVSIVVKDDNNEDVLLYTEAFLLQFYNNYCVKEFDNNGEALTKTDERGNITVTIKSKLEEELKGKKLLDCLNYIDYREKRLSLAYLLDRIDIMMPMKE